MRYDPNKWSVPVTYRGTRFRSHLEARWAVFFDELGIKYQYEPVLERVQGMLYVPDFYLESLELVVEIKPKEPNHSELLKAAGWVNDMLEPVLILFGPLKPPPDGVNGWLMDLPSKRSVPVLRKDYWFCECPRCGRIGISERGGVPEECMETCFNDTDEDEEILLTHDGHLSPKLLAAYEKARAFRFEPSSSRTRPKYPSGPPTPRMVDFLERLLERAGAEVPAREVLESMRFDEVKTWIDELLHKEDDEWR